MARKTGSCRLALFKIGLANSYSKNDSLYANGRHQCGIIIQVVKEVFTASGQWERAALTDEECASVTVCKFSEQAIQGLPEGWSCDNEKNIYSVGLYQPGVGAKKLISYLDPHVDNIVRYLRVDGVGVHDEVEFMAVMCLEGETYTTALLNAKSSSGSSVIIKSVAPYGLPVESLEAYADTGAFADGFTLVAVYYWVLPRGMWIVENKGIDKPVTIPDEGDNFKTIEVFNYGFGDLGLKIGVVINKDNPGLLLRTDDIHKNLPTSVPNPVIRFYERPTLMRAVRLISTVFPVPSKGDGLWRLVDNFGSEHRYFLSLAGNGSIIIESRGELEPEFRVVRFFVDLPNGQDFTNALYANNNHQCQVNIEVILEQKKSMGSGSGYR